MFEAVKGRAITRPFGSNLWKRKAGHRGAGATPRWRNGPPEQPRSAARQASSASGSKAEVKKREIAGQFEGVVARFPGLPGRSRSGEDDLLGRALHQHKLHFAEVDGLRRDQPSGIFLKNDRLVFHEVK